MKTVSKYNFFYVHKHVKVKFGGLGFNVVYCDFKESLHNSSWRYNNAEVKS